MQLTQYIQSPSWGRAVGCAWQESCFQLWRKPCVRPHISTSELVNKTSLPSYFRQQVELSSWHLQWSILLISFLSPFRTNNGQDEKACPCHSREGTAQSRRCDGNGASTYWHPWTRQPLRHHFKFVVIWQGIFVGFSKLQQGGSVTVCRRQCHGWVPGHLSS